MSASKRDYKEILKDLLCPPGDFADVYAFSIHKAGSTLLHTMIRDVCTRAKIPALSIPDALFKEGIFEREWGVDEGVLDIIVPGRVYYGFRHLPEVLLADSVDLRSKRCVLLVRDPRDALVSEYFSYGGKYVSHKLPGKNQETFLQQVKATGHLSIDEYVLRAARNHLGKLQAYREHLGFERVLLRRYEDVYFDKRSFLSEIFEHFGFEIEPSLLDEVARANDIRPEVEDPQRHIRKGTPGDYADKLAGKTIESLNQLFAETCRWYGYDLGQ